MKTFSLLIITLALSACGSVLPKGAPSPAYYTLNASTDGKDQAKTIPVSLRILMPQAAPGLETEQIALRKDAHQIDYYSDVRWSGRLTALVQSQLVRSFDATQRLNSVSNDLVAVNQDYSLLVEIQDFQIEYQGSAQSAHVNLTAKLIDMKSSKIVTTATYNEIEKVNDNTMRHVINAFDSAYQRASKILVKDVLKTLEKSFSPSQRKSK